MTDPLFVAALGLKIERGPGDTVKLTQGDNETLLSRENWDRINEAVSSSVPVCGNRSPLNYDHTRWAACTLPVGHNGDHRQGDLGWTDRTMPCRVDR